MLLIDVVGMYTLSFVQVYVARQLRQHFVVCVS